LRERTLEKNKFDMLKGKAVAYDVDPAGDYMKPGNNPPEQAFQLLRCGLHLLLHVSDNAFPAIDSRTRKRGPKWIRQGILFNGDKGTLLLAHAVPALMAKLDGRLGGDEPPELTGDHHRRFYETVKSFYPLMKGANFVEQCMREFEVMETHEVRPVVVEGVQPANEYSQALMRGENPDEDPGLVAMQRDYARDYFIDRAIFVAIRQTLSPNDQKLLQDKLFRFVMVEDAEAAELRSRSRRAWIEGIGPYLEYARLDAQ
jgi:hypothetical protein